MPATNSRFRLDQKRALVTGASRGLGAEIASAFAAAGADLRSTEAVQRLADQARERFGTIDILVNNAGIVHEEKIINISSVAAVLAPEGHAAYSASKGGLNLLTQTMAAEWGRYNIQANAVAPTVILTEMGQQGWGEASKSAPMKARFPAGRFGEPVEVADLVLILASNASNFLCGPVIRLDGGLTVVRGAA